MTIPQRILFFMEDLCYGGTQRQTLELARRLDRTRFTPVMLTLTGPTDLDEAARDAGIELHHMGHDRKVPPLFFAALYSKLRRLQPDVIVPCTALPNIWGRIWGRLGWLGEKCSPRIVGTCRGGGGPKRQHERWLWRLTDHMICNSEALHEILLYFGLPQSRLSYIPNGVDTEFFAPSGAAPSARAPEIVCVARLAGDKDHLTLMRAFEIVLQRHPSARLRIVGDGPEEANLACGLPVCATSVGGIPRLVENGQNGLLSHAGDVAALGENCCRLLEDGALCDAMGQDGRLRVERDFSFTAMVEAHQAVFAGLRRN